MLLVLGLACQSPPGLAASSAATECRVEPVVDGAPGLAEGVLIQAITASDRWGESGFRVWEDGRYERRQRGGPWVVQPPLDALRLETLRAAIGGASLAQAAGWHRSTRPAEHSETGWVQAGGATVAIDTDCGVESVDRMFADIARIFGMVPPAPPG